MLRLLVIGAAGRMGRAVVRAALERRDVRVSAGLTALDGTHVGRDLGELAGVGPLGVHALGDASVALTECDAAIDFSLPAAAANNLAACCAAGKPLVIGTTGLTADLYRELERAARHIPLLVAPNTSLGLTLLLEMARQCARALPPQFDVEILDAHHRDKRDAPSGTALALGEAIAEERGAAFDPAAARSHVSGPRQEGEIGFAVLRGGDLVGEHTVIFAGSGEQLTLGHRVTDRAVFARGALEAAVWLAPQPPGRYTMRDVLFRTGS
ncbi:MAG TPA: 4-hydroxy-tetrahydrodipicolinate reductase [Steroidobacteraceae bacterium]|nr:4-hydroxy-tetrahydrodipicolinate reductase [Steroidobacteraceae bacterium]